MYRGRRAGGRRRASARPNLKLRESDVSGPDADTVDDEAKASDRAGGEPDRARASIVVQRPNAGC